jgi:nucleotide-binding universal stress UspA family protein
VPVGHQSFSQPLALVVHFCFRIRAALLEVPIGSWMFQQRDRMFKTVLFPIDQSREAREAADVVTQLMKVHQSDRLVLLSVVEPAEDADRVMTSPEAVAELLTNAKKLFAEAGILAETLEREGKPAFVICDVADEVGAQVIVMGCRGIGLTEGGATDSVTSRVINLSPCPVLVVP